MKIGRNDPCPCGSGKKYKKCCFKEENQNKNSFSKIAFQEYLRKSKQEIIDKEKVDASTFFNEFDNSELLKILALLQVLPENHGKYIRLEEITKQAIRANIESIKNVDIKLLKEFIIKKFPSNHLEDPPENLFTENIMTPFGNITVFTGITEKQVFILQKFINVISRNEIEINSEFKMEALKSARVMLTISDFIAKSMEYERNILAPNQESNDIYFPDIDYINKMKNCLFFSGDELTNILNINTDLLTEYLIDINDKRFLIDESDANPIIFNPVLKLGEEYIIISPATIVFSCVNMILRKAIKYNCLESFLFSYSKACWQHCQFILEELDHFEVSFDFPESKLPIHEGIYIFDTNKIAYIIFIYDNGHEYDTEAPLAYHKDNQDDKLKARRRLIYNLLISDNRFQTFDIIQINIVNGIGRPRSISYDPEELKWKVLAINLPDLEILYKSNKCHNLTLWNFVRATEEKPLSTPFFLDNISYFIENDESFYTSDEKIDGLFVAIGSAINFKSEAILNYDEHLAVFPKEVGFDLLPVTREKLPALLPIYSTRQIAWLPFMVVTPSLGKDIWIKTIDKFVNLKSEHKKFCAEICIAIGYWLSEMSSDLSSVIDLEHIKQIVIEVENIELKRIDDFEKIDKDRELAEEIIIKTLDHRLYIKLNEYFYYYLFRADNIAERILMQQILKAINSMLLEKGVYTNLSSNIITELLNKHIPIGQKKKLLILVGDSDFRISPQNVKTIRELSPFEINKQVDNLGVLLTSKPYFPRNNLENTEKKILINAVVAHFYKSLRNLLIPYKFEDILAKLLILYESSIQKREYFKFEMTPKIECFKEHTNIIDKISEDNKKKIQHTLSLRCLIEHIIAEPPNGSKAFDVSGIDSSLGFMYNIINWGLTSDQINFKISDVEVSLLPSGRIGTDKSFQENVMAHLYKAKVDEDVYDLEKRFKNKFKLRNNEDGNDSSDSDLQFDNAFLMEFDISYQDFSNILFTCELSAIEKDGSVYKNTKESFLKDISEELDILPELVDKVISKFSLFNRGEVENTEKYGFRNHDVYPWRYNRGLSFLKKPFVITVIHDIEYIWFGARSLIDFNFDLLNNINSGSYYAKSTELKSYLAGINNRNGKVFNNKVFDYLFAEFKGIGIYREIKINKWSVLKNNEDIGDLDILVIDDNRKAIIAIECKNVNMARTPYEMHQELMNFITGSNPWIPKVQKRDNWLKTNILSLKAINNNAGLENYKYEYIFLTSEAIPLPFIQENNIQYRFITFYDIKKDINIIYGDAA